jgi:hypothetical protein
VEVPEDQDDQSAKQDYSIQFKYRGSFSHSESGVKVKIEHIEKKLVFEGLFKDKSMELLQVGVKSSVMPKIILTFKEQIKVDMILTEQISTIRGYGKKVMNYFSSWGKSKEQKEEEIKEQKEEE